MLGFAIMFFCLSAMSSVAIAFANGMSDAPTERPLKQHVPLFFLGLSVVLFALWFFSGSAHATSGWIAAYARFVQQE